MMHVNRLSTVALVVVGSLVLTGCWPFGSADNIHNLAKSTQPELVIINVLDKPEFEDCHIQGSINITFDEFEAKMSSLNKNNHYVVYCADYMCMSSGFCAKLLLDAKFEHVWAYEGGMAEWYQKGFPFEGPAQSEYLTSENVNMADEDEQNHVPIITAEQLLEKMQQFASAQ